MRILVTGGTGFVGSHSVAALLEAGHEVRLLARSPERVSPTLAAIGVDASSVETVQGDVLDTASVDRALTGTDAVLHAASIYSLDPRRAEEIGRVNSLGTEHILRAAAERGLDPIVHVSSVAALYRQRTPVQRFDENAPPGDLPFPYLASKSAQERMARALQDEGAPLALTYPGLVFGPHDPYDGESTRLVRNWVRGWGTLCPRGDLAAVDVRDVAAVHAAAFEPGRGPRRFVIGQPLPARELVRMTLRCAGRSRPVVRVPDVTTITTGRFFDLLQSKLKARLPFGREAAWVATQHLEVDMSATNRLGVTCRPIDETLADQVAWQRQANRL